MNRVHNTITPKQSLWNDLKQYLKPTPEVSTSVWQQVCSRLQDVPHVSMPWQIARWSTAFVLVAVAIKISPIFFLAQPTTANDEVMLIATNNDVIYHSETGFKTLREGNQIQLTGPTQISSDGSFSVRWLNEGVIRGTNADIVVHDIASRKYATTQPTVDVLDGDVWVQGSVFNAGDTAPFSIKVNNSVVAVHGGSVAINKKEVAIHDSRATIFSDNTVTTLAYHQKLNLTTNAIETLSPQETSNEYVLQQLEYDAVHKEAIALRLQEHFQANVGISPDSNVYFLKLVAEEGDEFLTFDREAKLLKQAQQAQNRYVEAGVLLADNQAEKANEYLAEYRERLISLQNSPEGELLASNQLAENANTVAKLPSDATLYPIKETVLDASVELDNTFKAADAEKIKLIDDLRAFQKAAEDQDQAVVLEQWLALKDRIPTSDVAETADEQELSLEQKESAIFEQETRLIVADVALKVKEINEENNESNKRNPLLESLQEVAKITFEEEVKTPEQLAADDANKTLSLAEQFLTESLTFTQAQSQFNDILFSIKKAARGLNDDQEQLLKERILRSIYSLISYNSEHEQLIRFIKAEIVSMR